MSFTCTKRDDTKAMEGSYGQWRSKALRGSGSTVTWGPPFPSPPLPLPPLPLPFPSPFPPLLQPSPSPCREAAPANPARGLGERCKLPQRGLGRSPNRSRIWCILRTLLLIFFEVGLLFSCLNFFVAPLLGSSGTPVH